MDPFTRLSAIAATYDRDNVDTDQMLPGRFLLKRRSDKKYPTYLFHDLRFTPDEQPLSEFVLSQPAYRDAKIFVGRANFGGGSSREAAAIAFQTYGFRCVIAITFGDIFYNNCVKNGILPIRLDADTVASLHAQLGAQPGASLTIDLPSQQVIDVKGDTHAFEIDAFSKTCLIEGLSQIDLTLRHRAAIDAFETRYRQANPWA